MVTAVDGVDLMVERGEMLGYIGPNGAGKSTTLKMMTGVLTPSGGTVSVCGLVPVAAAHHARATDRCRVRPAFATVVGPAAAGLVRAAPAHLPGARQAEHAARLARCRSLLGLDEFEATPVRQLSLGQRMRAEITASLLHAPEVLFLDEPTIGLDVVSKHAVRAFLAEIGAVGDTTLVLTTHDLADIEKLCRRLVVIDHGVVVHDGSLEALHVRYGSRRLVVVDLDAPWDPGAASPAAGLPGVAHESTSPDGLRLTYALTDGATAGSLVGALAGVAALRDLSVIEPDIEDVIARLYADNHANLVDDGIDGDSQHLNGADRVGAS